MASFTAYINYTISCVVSVCFSIIIFLQVCAMTCGAHCIPVLCISCPVQPIVRWYFLSRILMKPFFILSVPGCSCCLHSASGKLYKILLQRIITESIFYLIVVVLTIITLGVDKIFSIVFEEMTCNAISYEC